MASFLRLTSFSPKLLLTRHWHFPADIQGSIQGIKTWQEIKKIYAMTARRTERVSVARNMRFRRLESLSSVSDVVLKQLHTVLSGSSVSECLYAYQNLTWPLSTAASQCAVAGVVAEVEVSRDMRRLADVLCFLLKDRKDMVHAPSQADFTRLLTLVVDLCRAASADGDSDVILALYRYLVVLSDGSLRRACGFYVLDDLVAETVSRSMSMLSLDSHIYFLTSTPKEQSNALAQQSATILFERMGEVARSQLVAVAYRMSLVGLDEVGRWLEPLDRLCASQFRGLQACTIDQLCHLFFAEKYIAQYIDFKGMLAGDPSNVAPSALVSILWYSACMLDTPLSIVVNVLGYICDTRLRTLTVGELSNLCSVLGVARFRDLALAHTRQVQDCHLLRKLPGDVGRVFSLAKDLVEEFSACDLSTGLALHFCNVSFNLVHYFPTDSRALSTLRLLLHRSLRQANWAGLADDEFVRKSNARELDGTDRLLPLDLSKCFVTMAEMAKFAEIDMQSHFSLLTLLLDAAHCVVPECGDLSLPQCARFCQSCVKLRCRPEKWLAYIVRTLTDLHEHGDLLSLDKAKHLSVCTNAMAMLDVLLPVDLLTDIAQWLASLRSDVISDIKMPVSILLWSMLFLSGRARPVGLPHLRLAAENVVSATLITGMPASRLVSDVLVYLDPGKHIPPRPGKSRLGSRLQWALEQCLGPVFQLDFDTGLGFTVHAAFCFDANGRPDQLKSPLVDTGSESTDGTEVKDDGGFTGTYWRLDDRVIGERQQHEHTGRRVAVFEVASAGCIYLDDRLFGELRSRIFLLESRGWAVVCMKSPSNHHSDGFLYQYVCESIRRAYETRHLSVSYRNHIELKESLFNSKPH